MKHLLALLLLLPSIAFSQGIGGIEIQFNSGKSLITEYVYIYSGYGNSYVQIDGKKGQKVPINLVKSIEGKDKYGNFRHFNPINSDGYITWGERVFKSDRISLYSTSSFNFEYQSEVGDVYYKDDNGAYDLKYGNLKRDLSDSPIAMEYLKQANGYRTAQGLLWTASVGLFIAGVSKMASSTTPEEPGQSKGMPAEFLIAGGVNLVGWLLQSPKRQKFREALKAY